MEVRPKLATLPAERTICFYGQDEAADGDTACTFPEIAKATIVERPGGHHFDGDYEPVARAILERLEARQALR